MSTTAMTIPTRAPDLRVNPVAWMFLVVVSFVSGGCGANQTQLQSDLVGTEWIIVEMTGFPDDNIVAGNFDFTNERFRYYDGVNHKTSEIDWTESGFTVKSRGTTTDKAHSGYPGPYLDTLILARTHVKVAKRADGALTLTQGDLTVTAEPA